MSESYTFEFVEGYSEDPEISRTKGWVSGTLTLSDGRTYHLYFATPHRFSQDASSELARGVPYYAEVNVVIVADITRDLVLAAVRSMVADGNVSNLCAESSRE